MPHGSCLCGAVTFDVTAQLRDVVACHCSQCRAVSGHYWAATAAPIPDVHMTRDEGLAWFRSSSTAKRGFCRLCGSTLFWQADANAHLSISPGALDGSTGLQTTAHWFAESAGDYYNPAGGPPLPCSDVPDELTGGCLCGAAQFTLPGPAGNITACHCQQCRKISGHYSASFDVDEAAMTWQSNRTVTEYKTPGGGQRGFCTTCGSSLYFRAKDGGLSVEAGAIKGATGGRLTAHIFVADKGDYYTLDDGLPQSPGGD